MKSAKARKQAKSREEKSNGAFVALASVQRTGAPKVVRSDAHSRRIVHRELVGSVAGSVAFETTRYVLNPGMAATFPWLSTQAAGWEQYTFHRLKFEYVTRTATSTVGSVILSPEYDPTDPAPTTEAIAAAAMDAVEDATWKNITCDLTPYAMFPLGPRKFIRATMTAGDLRTFDAGNLFLGTVEETGTAAIGKLWVEYDVELYIPQLHPQPTQASSTSFFTTSGNQTYATGVAAVYQNWAAATADGLHLGAPTVGVWTLPAGAYIITMQCMWFDTAAEACTANIALRRSGVAVSQAESNATALANGDGMLTVKAVVISDGTTTVDVLGTMTGAAGTLTLRQAGIVFEAA